MPSFPGDVERFGGAHGGEMSHESYLGSEGCLGGERLGSDAARTKNRDPSVLVGPLPSPEVRRDDGTASSTPKVKKSRRASLLFSAE